MRLFVGASLFLVFGCFCLRAQSDLERILAYTGFQNSNSVEEACKNLRSVLRDVERCPSETQALLAAKRISDDFYTEEDLNAIVDFCLERKALDFDQIETIGKEKGWSDQKIREEAKAFLIKLIDLANKNGKKSFLEYMCEGYFHINFRGISVTRFLVGFQ